MDPGDADSVDPRDALDRIAASEVDGLIAEALRDARARFRSELSDAITQALWRRMGSRPTNLPNASDPLEGEGPAARQDAEAEATDERGWYVYAIVEAPPPEHVPGLSGVEPGVPVSFIEAGGLAAAVSSVSLAEFEEEQFRAHVNDLEWLELKVRAHEAVLERVMADGPLLPMRFGTIYRLREDVERHLRDHASSLLALLQSLRGREEWGVKLRSDRKTLREWLTTHSPRLVDLGGDGLPHGEGAEYLAGRRAEEALREESARAIAEASAACAAALGEVVTEAAPLTPHPDEGIVWHQAVLVDDARLGELDSAVHDLASRLQPQGFSLEATGPWPPYNFVSVELSSEAIP